MKQPTGGGGNCELVCALPGPGIRHAVRLYRGFVLKNNVQQPYVKYPDVMTTMVFAINGMLAVSGLSKSTGAGKSFEVAICGPHTKTFIGSAGDELCGLHVKLAPWAAFSIFGNPMHELANTVLEHSELTHKFSDTLTARLREAENWKECFAVLDELLEGGINAGSSEPQVTRAWQTLIRSAGRTSVGSLAYDAGVCERQLQARFREQVGLSPKACLNILRIRRALRQLAAGRAIREVALECGFYDQAHLSHVFKEMTGHTPSNHPAGSWL